MLSRFCIVKWKRRFRCRIWWSTRWGSQLSSSRLGRSLNKTSFSRKHPSRDATFFGPKMLGRHACGTKLPLKQIWKSMLKEWRAPFERALCSSWHLCIAWRFLGLVNAHFNSLCTFEKCTFVPSWDTKNGLKNAKKDPKNDPKRVRNI